MRCSAAARSDAIRTWSACAPARAASSSSVSGRFRNTLLIWSMIFMRTEVYDREISRTIESGAIPEHWPSPRSSRSICGGLPPHGV
jgi:hypothetical protein